MVFNLFKKKTETPDSVIPVSRIARAASVEESLLTPPPPPAPPPPPEPEASEPPPPPPVEAPKAPPRAFSQDPVKMDEPANDQAAPEDTMRPYHKIPPEFFEGPFAGYLKKDLGLKPGDDWNIIALPVKAEDVMVLRTMQHPGRTLPLHGAALSLTIPLLKASFDRQKEGLQQRGEERSSMAYQAVVRHARSELIGVADYTIQETLFKAIKREEFFPDPNRSELFLTSLGSIPKPDKNSKPHEPQFIDLTDPVVAEQYRLTPYHVIPRLFWENEFALLMRNTLALDPDAAWNVVMLPLEVEDAVRLGRHAHPGEPPRDHIDAVRNMMRVINAEFALKSSQIGVMHTGEFSSELAELMLKTSERVQSLAGLHVKKLSGPMKDMKTVRRVAG